jgi:hypothetical protein
MIGNQHDPARPESGDGYLVDTPLFDEFAATEIESDAPCSVWGVLSGPDAMWD